MDTDVEYYGEYRAYIEDFVKTIDPVNKHAAVLKVRDSTFHGLDHCENLKSLVIADDFVRSIVTNRAAV